MATHEPHRPSAGLAGLLAEFASAEAVRAAASSLRNAGWTHWDVHSPFPVHSIESAMGLRRTGLPWLVLAAGLAGVLLAAGMQPWTNGIDYPLIISGKPLLSLPTSVPIMFELAVLLAALAAFGGALVLGGLPRYGHPAFSSLHFRRATTDGFFVFLSAEDPRFDAAAGQALLQSAGAVAVEPLQLDASSGRAPSAVYWALATAAVLALLPPVLVTWYRARPKPNPRIHLIHDMDFQEKYLPQGSSPLFADGRAMRPPVPGTIARGTLEADEHLYAGKVAGQWAARFPVPPTAAMMERGKSRYAIFCATCHGLVGEGGVTGITSARAVKRREPNWVLPLSLHTPAVREQPVGQLFHTITHGARTMPAHGAQIPAEDRWAIVLYVRALQRSQNATLDDVPQAVRPQLRP